MPIKKDRYTRSVLTPVQSEVHLYAIAMQDTKKPLDPRHVVLDVSKRYTRDEAISRASQLNMTHSTVLMQLGFNRFVPYNTSAE